MIYTIVVRKNDNTLDKLISFDSITSFNDSISAKIVTNPVEEGFPIADHTVLENRRFSISGIITAYSVFDEGLELVWKDGGFSSVNEGNASGVSDRHLRIEQELRDLVENRVVFSLLRSVDNSHAFDDAEKEKQLQNSQVELIPNCMISSLEFSQSSGMNGAIFPQLSIEKVRVAKTQTEQLSEDEQLPALQAREMPTGKATTSTSTTTDDKTTSSTGENDADKTTLNKVNSKTAEQLQYEKETTREIATTRGRTAELAKETAQIEQYRKRLAEEKMW